MVHLGPVPREATLLRARSLEDKELRRGLAECLSSAFSSGIWRSNPMPLGHSRDPNSAIGVIEGLGDRPVVIAAAAAAPAGPYRRLLGCVLGAVLDRRIIEEYRLAPFAARPGDGLLAFIGLVPGAQGHRVRRRHDNALEIIGGRENGGRGSLARHLFEEWIQSIPIRECPRVFIRTRRRIAPVLHLSKSSGFEYRGEFEVDFRGELQERLVFVRTNRSDQAPAHAATTHRIVGNRCQ